MFFYEKCTINKRFYVKGYVKILLFIYWYLYFYNLVPSTKKNNSNTVSQ